MPISAETILASMVLWAAPFLRLSAMMMIAPVFSASGFNVRTRALLAALIAAVVAPMMPPTPVAELFSAEGVLMAIREMTVGFAMGFVLQLVFGAVVFAGQAVAMTMGLGFAISMDPQNGVSVPVISQFNVILTTLLFLAIDGHLVLIRAVIESYQVVPVAVAGLPVSTFAKMTSYGSQLFASGMLLALPAMTALILVNISFGVMTSAAPQLNIFAVGFPLTLMAGFLLLFLSMPGFISGLTSMLQAGLESTLMVWD